MKRHKFTVHILNLSLVFIALQVHEIKRVLLVHKEVMLHCAGDCSSSALLICQWRELQKVVSLSKNGHLLMMANHGV